MSRGPFSAYVRTQWRLTNVDTQRSQTSSKRALRFLFGAISGFCRLALLMEPFRSIENKSRIVEITSRTIHGRFLMRPSAKANDLILGVLGRAQAKYDVELYSFVFLSNHFHLLMKADTVRQMAYFLGFLKGNIAKELGYLHDWTEKFWGRRYTHIPLADTEDDQILRQNYILQNGCKEGLVGSPLDWPGVSSAWAQLKGVSTMTGTWYDRTAQYRASLRGQRETFPSTETVRLTPLPFLARQSAKRQRAFMADAIKRIEDETKNKHRKDGPRPLSRKAILRQDPHSKPSEFHRSPAPRFHAVNQEDFWNMRNTRLSKQIVYRRAAERLKRGERDVQFPEDCFPPRLPFVNSRAPT